MVKKTIVVIFFIFLIFFALRSFKIPNSRVMCDSTYRKLSLFGEIEVFDALSGERVFSYNPDYGYVLKSINKDGDVYFVEFKIMPD